jgi:pSer/pThr/pTyr-binding forkhead associated (FHA) protein
MLEFILSFVAGKDQGREFPLPKDLELVVGRVSDADLLILDERVSRKHARISTRGGKVVIRDLSSRNGTFVNGKQVTTAELKLGDEILIGSSTLKLSSFSETRMIFPARIKTGQPAPLRAGATQRSSFMSGSIEEIKLTDLLQLLSDSRKGGVLSIRSGQTTGKIHLRNGQVYYASIEGNFAVRPYKALFRMFGWASGSFELGPPEEKAVTEEIADSTTTLLLEGMRNLDEMRLLDGKLPPPNALLAASASAQSSLRELATEELQIFQLVLHYRNLVDVIDHFPGPDLEAYTCLLALLKRGFILVNPSAPSA